MLNELTNCWRPCPALNGVRSNLCSVIGVFIWPNMYYLIKGTNFRVKKSRKRRKFLPFFIGLAKTFYYFINRSRNQVICSKFVNHCPPFFFNILALMVMKESRLSKEKDKKNINFSYLKIMCFSRQALLKVTSIKG